LCRPPGTGKLEQDGGRTMDSVITKHRADVEALCRRYGVIRLELFGSASTDRNLADESDIDFLVEFDGHHPGGYADAYFRMLESLEKLFGRPVDLVVAPAIKNPYFLQAVERTKTLLYAA
jgi:predicted nucleotidyltransferase